MLRSSVFRRAAIAVVLAIALQAGKARAATVDCTGTAGTCLVAGKVYDTSLKGVSDAKCDVANNGVCDPVPNTTGYQACCVDPTCGNTSDAAECLPGYVFSSAAVPGSTLCTATPTTSCASGPGHTSCCVATKCSGIDADYCPYGLKADTTGTPHEIAANAIAVHKCCVEDTSKLDAFPKCWAPGVAGATAMQALDADDTNWGIQDNSGFGRSLGKYGGICFAITTKHDCSLGDEVVAPQCCTSRLPAYLQVKLPTTLGASGDQSAPAAALTGACRLSYGSELANARSLKRITKLTAANGDATTAKAQYVNVPLAFKKNQRQITVCLYTLSAAPGSIDCSWDKICGLSGTSPVVNDATGYATGCQVRMVGRKSAGSAACCTPAFSVDAFDSSESRLAANAAQSGPVFNLLV